MPASAPTGRRLMPSLSSYAARAAPRFIARRRLARTATGASFSRCSKHLASGDVVTVTRIDRLARSTFDLFAIVKQIVDAEAQFRSLAEPWADTGTSTGRLMMPCRRLADVERDLIRTRTAEGRSRAQKRGQHMGRPPKLTLSSRRQRPGGAGRKARPRRTCAQLRRGQEHDFEAECPPTATKADRF